MSQDVAGLGFDAILFDGTSSTGAKYWAVNGTSCSAVRTFYFLQDVVSTARNVRVYEKQRARRHSKSKHHAPKADMAFAENAQNRVSGFP